MAENEDEDDDGPLTMKCDRESPDRNWEMKHSSSLQVILERIAQQKIRDGFDTLSEGLYINFDILII